MEPKELNRVILKRGGVNTSKNNVGRHIKRYIMDCFTSFLDAKWRWTFFIFIFSHIGTWTFFALLWYLMALAKGDIAYYSRWLDAHDKELFEMENPYTPCVRHLYSFSSAYLYSIETQQTTGYGFRHVTEECIGGPTLLTLQCLVGSFLTCFMMGGIIAKLARPKKRAQNVLFSKTAVICHRDGIPFLMFRIADTRKSHIVHASVKARIIRMRMTREGELMNFFQQELPLIIDECYDDRVLLAWPTIVTHKIDNKSPLYGLSAIDLQREQFEIVIMLEGGVEATGLAAQARTSYLPSEIFWGYRFQNIVSYDEKSTEYNIDYNLFHNMIKVEGSPTCSPKQLDRDVTINNLNQNSTRNNQEIVLHPSVNMNGHTKSID